MSAASYQAFAINNDSTTPVFESGAQVTRLDLIVAITPYLSVSGTTASYSLYVIGIPSVNSINAKLQIQQLVSGKWHDYGSPWSVSSSTSYLSTSGTKNVVSGYSYRLKVVITASNGTETGEATVYS